MNISDLSILSFSFYFYLRAEGYKLPEPLCSHGVFGSADPLYLGQHGCKSSISALIAPSSSASMSHTSCTSSI